MARPRVFISSTFYDLRQIRDDLERAIKELGFEPIRHETGAIPYDKQERPESAAYREIDLCDVIVSVIGGRFGTESRQIPGYSISQNELRRALERGIQVFIFVDKNVQSEYSTYELNKDVKGVRYRFIDDLRVFTFLEEIHALPQNNPIASFEVASDITNYLRDQFAGLFQRFLSDQKRGVELRVLDEMNAVAKTLKEVVTFLTAYRNDSEQAIRSILVAHHPAFRRLAELTKTTYRVYFSNRAEMIAWMQARGWTQVATERLDQGSIEEWLHQKDAQLIKIRHQLFDAGEQLMIVQPEQWQSDWIIRVPYEAPPPDDDDVPF